jgi:Ca2+-binding RTX toxin-like protein
LSLVLSTRSSQGEAHVQIDNLLSFERGGLQAGASIDAIELDDGTQISMLELLGHARETEQDDLLFAVPTRHVLSGGGGQDTLVGTLGDETLSGGSGYNIILPGAGNDLIIGDGGLVDVSFGVMEGNDTVKAGSQAQVRFGPTVSLSSLFVDAPEPGRSEVVLRQQDHAGSVSLTTSGNWSDVSVAVGEPSNWKRISVQDLLDAVDAAEALAGGAQADKLSGKRNHDTLMGLAGDDTLDGGAGNDQLTGGLGNDGIAGGQGADTVFFNAGDGQDLVRADSLDTLVLGAALTRSSLQVSQLPVTGGNSLSLGFVGLADRITLDQLGNWDGLTVKFADGTSTTGSALIQEARVQPINLKGTNGKDMLAGQSKADTLSGLAGNDTLVGNLGNDTLIGGSGADTYRFKRGDGRDTLIENDINTLNKDVLAFGDVASNQLWFARSGQSLVVSVIGTQDQVTVQDWFKGSAYRVEAFTSGDGKSLSSSRVNNLVSAMAKFSAPAEGSTTLPVTTAKALQPVLATSWV